MTQIIKGLYFHYTATDLAEQMRARAAHHEGRATQKEGALPELRKAVETVRASAEAKSVAQMSKGVAYNFDAGNQVEQLEHDIRDHKNKALVFRTLAEHLVPGATYELDESALRRLEILK